MKELCYTLLSDGSSDRAFIPILDWLFQENKVRLAVQGKWANLGQLPKPPKPLEDRIAITLQLYPCDLLFIKKALDKIKIDDRQLIIYIIPIRMLETWLLFDEFAIKKVAGNPHSKDRLNLPKINSLENLSNPKEKLCEILRNTSGLTGRKLKDFKAREREKIHRIAWEIKDFSVLRQLSAFQILETDIRDILQQNNWV
jgi:hypothetical protein